MKNLVMMGSVILMLSCSLQKVAQSPDQIDFREASHKGESWPVRSESIPILYIDFNAGFIQHPHWNNGNGFYCAPSALSTANKMLVVQQVEQVYQNFKILITTDVNIFNEAKVKQRIIVTPSSSWYRGFVSGVSYINSFNTNDPAPAFVFSNNLDENPGYIGNIIMHESGHTLGLHHQSEYDSTGALVNSYRVGAIMGYPFNVNKPTWVNGTSTGCNVYQNDALILQEKLGLK